MHVAARLSAQVPCCRVSISCSQAGESPLRPWIEIVLRARVASPRSPHEGGCVVSTYCIYLLATAYCMVQSASHLQPLLPVQKWSELETCSPAQRTVYGRLPTCKGLRFAVGLGL